MIIIKTKEEIAKLRIAGKILARIIDELKKEVEPGITTKSLEASVDALIAKAGAKGSLRGYRPEGADRPYPSSICISVNDEVVHGIPGSRILKDGDIISLDLVINHDGVFVDHTMTVPVGKISKNDQILLSATEGSLYEGIHAIKPGATTGDIGYAIQSYLKPYKLGIVRDLSGHGVGRKIHEDPYVPNYGKPGKGDLLKPGMVIAIEPMCTLGSEQVLLLRDGYTLITSDKSRAAHFEHTVLIREDGYPEILTTL